MNTNDPAIAPPRIKWRFALDDLPELRALLPGGVMAQSCDARADTVLRWVWSHCYETGVDGPGLAGAYRYSAMGVYRWWLSRQSENDKRGPAMSCGSVGYLTIGMLSSVGIPAVVLGASNQYGQADISVQYWCPDKPGWVHVLPAFNAHFESLNGQRLSYVEWSTLERTQRNRNAFKCVSPTGGADYWKEPLLVPYREWVGFTLAAFVQAGNAILINGDPCPCIEIWSDPNVEGKLGKTQPSSFADIEPNLGRAYGH